MIRPQKLLQLALLCRHSCQALVKTFAFGCMLIFVRLDLSLISLDERQRVGELASQPGTLLNHLLILAAKAVETLLRAAQLPRSFVDSPDCLIAFLGCDGQMMHQQSHALLRARYARA